MSDEERKIQNAATMILAVTLIALGILFLLGEFLHLSLVGYVWPFAVIIPGILMFLSALNLGGDRGQGYAMGGGIITVVGLLLLVQTVTELWASWAYAWALVFPTAPGLALVIYGSITKREQNVVEGWRLTWLGLIIFLVGLLFFEGLLGIDGVTLSGWLMPLVLIGIGAFILFHTLRSQR